jgi:site-specific DNA-methyltransferase (adenine-specific)
MKDDDRGSVAIHCSTAFALDVVIQGDCIDVMRSWPDGCVNAIITDPPYGITANQWDNVPNLDAFWREAWRVCRGPVVMTASQPFTSEVVMSQRDAFKHEWIWQKNRGSNFANTVREPFKEHESVLVFAKSKWTYNPIRQSRSGSGAERAKYSVDVNTKTSNYGGFKDQERKEFTEDRVPSSVQRFNTETGLHPTQKPQKLFEYLIQTYTNEGDVVCDPFGGSGTTAAAAKNTGRRYVSIEAKADYVEIQRQRLAQGVLF